jgi:hypothetical protein
MEFERERTTFAERAVMRSNPSELTPKSIGRVVKKWVEMKEERETRRRRKGRQMASSALPCIT